MADEHLCECHGEPMLWHKTARLKAGGSWCCAAKARAAGRRWREQNQEKHRERTRKWREQNPEKYRESNRESNRKWREQNPEKARARDAWTNARRIHVGGAYLGTENTFPVPREAVEKFALQMITQHRQDNARKSVDALAETL